MENSKIGKKHKFIRSFLLVMLLAFFSYPQPLAAAPDKAGVADLDKEAKKEGTVTFYTSILATDAMALIGRFEKKYPFIKVNLYRLNNEGILDRVLAEKRANRNIVDVLDLKGDMIHDMKEMKLLARYPSPERQFFAEGFKDKDGYWTDVYLTVHSVAYNTRLVAPHEVPTSYRDLLKPQWKGKIGFNPNNYMWPETIMQTMGEEEGLKFLEALARQNPLVRGGGTLNTILTAAGEVALALPINNNNVETVRAKGAPVDWAKIKPFYGDMHPIALAANAPHPNASKLFIDFILSQEGQQQVAELGKIPPRSGINSRLVKSEEVTPIDPSLGKSEYYKKLVRQIFVKK